jgi:alanyl-tRNA synthetase
MTEKLFYADSYLRQFTARVVRRVTVGKQPGVVLDRTAFYATAGGQPHDTGMLRSGQGGVRVLDVIEDEGSDDIVHVLAGPLDSDEAIGAINWERRFDHMQQHSGQHILSQAFVETLNAPTVSFHLGADVCTIDVQLAAMTATLTATAAATVEDLANSVIVADAAVRIHEVTQADLGRFPLRKQPVVSGIIRIVEMDGFDYSPCGGTHVRSTGEIGLIKIRRWERRGETVRIDFLCGRRALLDYRWKNDTVNSLAAAMSIKDADLGTAVERSLAQGRDTFRALEEARSRLMQLEARAMLAETPLLDGKRVIVRVFDDRTAEEARRLAMDLAAAPATIVLFGLRAAGRASLIFGRSADLPHDMNAVLKTVAPIISGRGGGTPNLAQGGGPGLDRLDEALAEARNHALAL